MASQNRDESTASSENYIANVAIVGAGGNCGTYIVEALLKTGKHTVTAISRRGSTSKLPNGIHVKHVDYNDHTSLVAALEGNDALVITMGVSAPKDQEQKLVRAAAEADVAWILPNEWGTDTANDALSNDTLIGKSKKDIRELVKTLGKSSWIAVTTGFWYEWSLAIEVAYGFNFDKRTVTFFDDGETKINTSTWPQVGRTVASLLSLQVQSTGHGPSLDNFRNSHIYVSSFTVSQKDMFDSVMRVTETNFEDWKITKEPAHRRYAAGMEQMQSGDRMGFAKLLYSRVFYADDSGNFEKTRGLQNGVLGLVGENLDEYTAKAIQRSKDFTW